mgnify:CR=1 FL=1
MARKITSEQLVYWAAGPKEKEPEYRFKQRTFKRRPESPGMFKEKLNEYTRR